MIFDAFLPLAGLISSRGGRWRRGSIAGSEAGAKGATWMLGGGRDGGGFWAGAGRVGGRVFGWGRAGRRGGGGTWRYVYITWIWTDPMRTVRSKERARGQKSWRKTDPSGTPLGEKETPLGEKVTKVGEKKNFVGEKKIHRQFHVLQCLRLP